ncbi:MAG: Gfo/Idh/MocA family oxidoreductase [Acidimicrobiales bacterium]
MFRLGLVGAGRMGRTHLRALRESSDVGIVAVAEPLDALREEAVAAFDVAGYSSLSDMLASGGIDGVLIVTPSDSHVDVIALVAAAGLPILCEKPCGVSADDTRRAQKIVRDAGVALQIGYWRRFVPTLELLREGIESGHFGDVLSLSCLQWDGAPPSSAFRSRSGGVFIDMGVHEFDQARWLTGSDFTSMAAVASPAISDPDVSDDPDSAQVLCATTSGATVFVSLGRHYDGGDMASIEVFGSKDHMHSVFLDPDDGERAQLEALVLQAQSFAEYARGGPCRGASVEDAIAALEAAARAAGQLAASR